MWIYLILLYGVLTGVYNLIGKKSTQKSSPFNILILLITSGFLFVLWRIPELSGMNYTALPYIFANSLCMIISWVCMFKAISGLDISRVVIINNASIIITIVGGLLIFSESLAWFNIVGVICILAGVILTGMDNPHKGEYKGYLYVILALASAICRGIAGLLDKQILLMIEPGQFQFWYYLIQLVMVWIMVLVVFIYKKQFPLKVGDLKNYWIYIASLIYVVGDILLYNAYAQPDSKVIIATMLARVSLVITFVGGIVFFKEKPKLRNYLFLLAVILGLILVVL